MAITVSRFPPPAPDGAAPASVGIARVNGVALHGPAEHLAQPELRQRACTELLRQQALRAGLLDADDEPQADGTTSVAATAAIEALLERELKVPEPGEEACRRYHATHPGTSGRGERARVRHVLLAVTPGVDVARLRQRAEALLLELRCAPAQVRDAAFAQAAREYSNCPSGAEGGELGWLTRGDCAPEFARAIFESRQVGVLSKLVATRFGLHVIDVQEREKPELRPFAEVHGHIAARLREQAWVNALRQYLQLLAGQADIEGLVLDSASTPLVQ